IGVVALAAIVIASSRSGHHSGGAHAQRSPNAVQPAKRHPSPGISEAGGGDPSRFAVKLSGPTPIHLRFSHSPRAGVLFDMRTGRVLWQLDPTRRLPIASLTKMMTALVVVENNGPHDRVAISARARHTPGSAVGVLPKHRKVQLEALLNGLLLVSG